jgi:poly(glycerol-phosphate) alpha-glucosyltransferase
LNIGFVTPSISRAAGGIFEIERRLGQSLDSLPDTSVSVFGLHDVFTAQDESAWRPLKPQTFPVRGPRSFGYAPELVSALESAKLDVAHSHALWMYTSVAVNRWARSQKRPYLVTLNGMIDPWAIRNSRWKKRVALALYERCSLNEAACLQVNSEAELKSARDFGLKNPVAIIPNGIDLPASGKQHAESGNAPWSGYVEPGRKVLLFLSRIHPKKGLVNLFKAWARTRNAGGGSRKDETWVLAIAGWEQGGHEAELKQLATELGIAWADIRNQQPAMSQQASILFLGPQFNEAKAACLEQCDAFILPSFSEGLPMAVLEAWAHGKLVLMTPACNLPDGYAANAALRIEADAQSIGHALGELFAASPAELAAFGGNGRALVEQKFTWPTVAAELRRVYAWMLGDAGPPDSLVFK